MVLNQFRRRYSFHFRVVVWSLAAIFPVAFGFMTTVDAGVFMAIISLLVALVVTQVLFNDVGVRSQGGADSTTSGDISGDEVG
jgi:ABC-type branched-subunit amino acid transport system permease subunit